MVIIENVKVAGIEEAVRAARNPLSSWEKSDSQYNKDGEFLLGDADRKLLQNLGKAGVEHRTYARMIQAWMDITAPLTVWKQLDRYTVGKNQVSTSTMHTLHKRELKARDFSCEDIHSVEGTSAFFSVINALNRLVNEYQATGNKALQAEMYALLPESFNQKRTVNMSYETAIKIIRERENHKLHDWVTIVETLKNLPYMGDIRNG